jgi:hypothetical protein
VKLPHSWDGVFAALEPKVLPELRKIADIRENPYALIRTQILSLEHQLASSSAHQQGGWIFPFVPPPSGADQFDSKIVTAVYFTHLSTSIYRAKSLTARSKIARCAQKLVDALDELKPDQKELLLTFLPDRRAVAFDDYIAATRELKDRALEIRKYAGRGWGKATSQSRHMFVDQLLNAAADHGGRLTLNKRNGRGSLMDALDLLSGYLPKAFSRGLSFSQLSRWRRTWLQNCEKKFGRTRS